MNINTDYSLPKKFRHYNNLFPHNIPPTPNTGLPSHEQDCLEANEFLRDEVRRYGLRIMTTEEKEGREIHDIIPIEGKEQSYSNEGSNNFPFHVEVPHYDLQDRPDYVMFFCLRGTVGAKTTIIHWSELFKRLNTQTRYDVPRAIYDLKLGESFNTDQKKRTQIYHPDGQVTLDLAEMEGFEQYGKDALHDIKKTIAYYYQEIVTEIQLQKGDILIFNNKNCIHGRNNFTDLIKYDGTQRWLKRVYLKSSR